MTFLSFLFVFEGFFQVKKTTVLQNFNKTEGGKSGILHIYSFRMLEEADKNLQGIHLVFS